MSGSLSAFATQSGWKIADLLPPLPMQNGDANWGRVKNPPILPKGYDPRDTPLTGTPGGKSIQDILDAPMVGIDKALGDLAMAPVKAVGDAAAATLGPIAMKSVWFIGGGLLIAIGLWAMLRGGPVVAGVKEGLAAVRAGK